MIRTTLMCDTVARNTQIRWVRGFVMALTAVFAVALATRSALAQTDFDVRPYNVGGQIHTGGIADSDGTFHPTQTVFGYGFGDNPLDPFFTEDPGFNSESGSGLTDGAVMAFDILGPDSGSALPFNLSYWDGTGAVSWGTVPSGESLESQIGIVHAERRLGHGVHRRVQSRSALKQRRHAPTPLGVLVGKRWQRGTRVGRWRGSGRGHLCARFAPSRWGRGEFKPLLHRL